jgi:hypothetical protein
MKGKIAAGLAAAFILGAGAAPATAQDPVPPATPPDPLPVVTATLGSTVRVVGAESLSGGPTRIRITLGGRSDRYRYGIVYALRPGTSTAKLRTALRSSRQSAFFGLVNRLEGSVGVFRRETRSFSVFLAAGTTYAVIDATNKSRARWRVTTFKTDFAISTAAFPTPTATVVMTDRAFRGPKVLPRNGIVRFRNAGRRLHSAAAYRLKPSATNSQVAARLRAGRFESFRRLTRGRDIDVAGIVSPGNEVFAEPPLQTAGRYVLLSSEKTGGQPQYRRGLFSFFTVR